MNPFDASPDAILQALVQIPSVNPDGDPGTKRTGEKACAEWVADFLQKIGADSVWMDQVLPDRPNVIGRFFTEKDVTASQKPKILFAPHGIGPGCKI